MAGGEGMLSQDVQAYLAVRRAMGFSMKWSGNLLRAFAAFCDAAGQHHVCAEAAIKWAGSSPSVRTRARRLGLVIRLARYLRAEDQRHEVPPPVFGSEDRKRRPTPYIYSREDIQRLVQAASEVGRYPHPEYRGLTYSTFFGLLASTGMRLSEAINLRLQDITPDGVVVRQTKFRKSRLLPLHPTADAVLERYLRRRISFAPLDDHVFVGLRKHKLLRHDVYVAFRRSIEKIGLPRSDRPRPTIHALRHTFAVRALETCPDDRDRITRHMVALSTYLGHGDIAYTYWYLEATPELMRNIAESCQRYFMGDRS
jgi:integrase/recombinase XerD